MASYYYFAYFEKYTESSMNANRELATKQAPITKIAFDMLCVKFTVELIAKHLPNRNGITENKIMNPVGRIKYPASTPFYGAELLDPVMPLIINTTMTLLCAW